MPAFDIDLTLDSLKIPNINGTFPFGTKITPTAENKGGLSTAEVNSNIMLPFAQMRPKVCSDNSTTSQVEYDAKIVFNAPTGVTPSAGYTLTMGDGTYIGCTVTYTNLMEYACTVMQSDGTTTLFEVPAGKTLSAMWNGTAWLWTTTGSVTANDPTPVSSAAVHAAIGDVTTIQDLSSQITNKISEVQNCVLKKYGDICFLTFTFSTTFTQPDGMVLFNLPVTPKNTTWYVTSTPNSSQRLYAIDTANTSVKMWWGNNQNIFLDHYVSVVFLAE